jgi:MATE family multidrug resistance protein
MSRELRPLLRLAVPVVLAEIGWMSMGLVDTLMVGPLGPAAIGAAGMGSALFFAIAVFGMGVMLGLDTLVSHAYGRGDLKDCLYWLESGTGLAFIVAPVIMALSYAALSTMGRWGLHPQVLALALPYLRVIILSTLPLILYATFRRYLQGIHAVAPVMVALVSANAVNALGNWMLVYGHLGAPALGVVGSAWATCAARTYMAAFLFASIAWAHRRRGDHPPRVPIRFNTSRFRMLLRLGGPAAGQVTLEVGVFAAVSALAGRLDPVSLGSHQIAVNLASLAFMVPLGLSSAAAVRVGHAVGAHESQRAVEAGWAAFAIGLGIMSAIAVAFVVTPAPMLRLFSTDDRVVTLGIRLLAIAAAFQVFDGTQAIATGVLRGVGDTRTPMVANVIGHWVFGLPAGYALCFWIGWGIAGLWVGLSIGLTLVAITLTIIWARLTRRLDALTHASPPGLPELL